MRDFTRVLLLPTALLVSSLTRAYSAAIEERDSNSTTVAAPLSIHPDQNFEGVDGSWSTFTLRVGTPEQTVRTLVSTAGYQTWVILPEGCQQASSYSNCAQMRGGIFNETASTSWDRIGIYGLSIEENLGLTGNAIYGYDRVGLSGVGEGGPNITNTTVGAMAAPDYEIGLFGINPKPTNFTNFNDGSPSYMTLLKEQKLIPSVSWGFTAGAKYRFNGVTASLTLGGYDASKFIENNVTFAFSPDNNRDIVVAIQSIVTPTQSQTSLSGTELLPSAVYAYIDSTVAQLWLPQEACEAFELEFGLEYDNATQLYLVNNTLHQTLLTRNPNITFTLAQAVSGGPTVDITLPYAAFDLNASAPFSNLSSNSRYFPLQRAQNSTQYTIGRAFLQEAYLTVDYESQKFNVSQCAWVEGAQEHIVAIPAYSGSSYPGTSRSKSSSSSSLSGGAIAGIAVGAAAGVIIIGGLLAWFLIRRRRSAKGVINEKLVADADSNRREGRGLHETVFPKAELEGSQVHDKKHLLAANTPGTPHSAAASSSYGTRSPDTPSGEGTHSSTRSGLPFSALSETSEADSRERALYEMPGDMPPVKEADGRQLSEKEAIDRRNQVYNGVEAPAEVTSPFNDGAREARRVNPEVVVRTNANSTTPLTRAPQDSLHPPSGLHRAFSFEAHDNDEELYE